MTRYRLIKIDPAKEEYADSLIVTLNKLEGWITRERQNLEIARAYMEKLTKGIALKEITGNKARTTSFGLSGGKIELTKAQVMS